MIEDVPEDVLKSLLMVKAQEEHDESQLDIYQGPIKFILKHLFTEASQSFLDKIARLFTQLIPLTAELKG